MMGRKVYGLLFSVATVWISFAFTEGSFVTFHTQEGCNATLLCKQTGNVTWLDSDTSQFVGPRFKTTFFSFFSTLLIKDVSHNDGGNITCVGQERNITISLEVCHNKVDTNTCDRAVQLGDRCTTEFMINKCKKSCSLCPAPNCTETILPVISTTAPNYTKAIDPVTPTTDPFSTQATTDSRSTLPTEDEGPRAGNSAASWHSGFQGLFALVSALVSILVLLSQGFMNL